MNRAALIRLFGRCGGYFIFESLSRRRPLVALYHGVTTNEQPTGSENYRWKHIPLRAFREQIDWLRRHFDIVPLFEIERLVLERHKPAKPLCSVTFDDGYRNNYLQAFPVLRELNIPATLFVTTGFVDRREPLWVDRLERAMSSTERDRELRARLKSAPTAERERVLNELGAPKTLDDKPDYAPLSWDEIREMHRAGWSIGAHTETHPILARENADTQRTEIKTSLERISSEVGECRHFAYPDGQPGTWNSDTKTALRDLGLSAAWTTETRRVRPWREKDVLELPRVALDAGHRNGRFEGLVSNMIPKLRQLHGTPHSISPLVEGGEKEGGVKAYFNRDPAGYARDYEGETSVGHSFRVRRERLLELLGSGTGRVLDIGCGPGVMTRDIVARGWSYDGVDAAPAMAEEARRRFADEPRARFSVGRVEEIAAPDATFDVVIAMGLVEYLPDDVAAIREMIRVLKPGGRLLVSLPNWWSPARMWDRWLLVPIVRFLGRKPNADVHHREYRPAAYSRLLAAHGFSPRQTVAYNFRIIPRPFDLWFGRAAARSGAALERLRTSPLQFIATGVIVEAYKKL